MEGRGRVQTFVTADRCPPCDSENDGSCSSRVQAVKTVLLQVSNCLLLFKLFFPHFFSDEKVFFERYSLNDTTLIFDLLNSCLQFGPLYCEYISAPREDSDVKAVGLR